MSLISWALEICKLCSPADTERSCWCQGRKRVLYSQKPTNRKYIRNKQEGSIFHWPAHHRTLGTLEMQFAEPSSEVINFRSLALELRGDNFINGTVYPFGRTTSVRILPLKTNEHVSNSVLASGHFFVKKKKKTWTIIDPGLSSALQNFLYLSSSGPPMSEGIMWQPFTSGWC